MSDETTVDGSDFVIREGTRYFLGWLQAGSMVRALWTGKREAAMTYTRAEAWAEVEKLPLALRVLCDVEAVPR